MHMRMRMHMHMSHAHVHVHVHVHVRVHVTDAAPRAPVPDSRHSTGRSRVLAFPTLNMDYWVLSERP